MNGTLGRPDLGRLQAEEETLRNEAKTSTRGHLEAEQHLEALTATQDALTQAVERHRTNAASLADVALADDTVCYLDSKLMIPATVTPATLRAAILDVNRNLNLARAQATNAVEAADQVLRATFKEYTARWPSPNLGIQPDSYPDYRQILDAITAHGLPERRRDWVRSIASWSGEDLVPLNGAFDTAIEEIEERLGPINRILRTLPFGARNWRLQIRLRRLSSEDVTSFRKELRALSSAATSDLSDDQIAQRFHQLKVFVDRIKRPAGNQSTRSRDDLLDVRRHVHVSAVAVDADGNEQATYHTLGGKSGGETQELVAFIVGSALRYQLGDEERDRPRFAPVLLDEAFVKADREFAGRAVQAGRASASRDRRSTPGQSACPGTARRPDHQRRERSDEGVLLPSRARTQMKSADDLRSAISKRLERRWAQFLVDGNDDEWPWTLPTGLPDSRSAAADFATIVHTAREVNDWAGRHGLAVTTTNRRIAGTAQQLPSHIGVPSIDAAAKVAGSGWTRRIAEGASRLATLRDALPRATVSDDRRSRRSICDRSRRWSTEPVVPW